MNTPLMFQQNEEGKMVAELLPDLFKGLSSFIKANKQKRSMEHSEKINYMEIASRIVGYQFEMQHLDMLVCLYDAVLKSKGELTLSEVTKIKTTVEERHTLINEALDKAEDVQKKI